MSIHQCHAEQLTLSFDPDRDRASLAVAGFLAGYTASTLEAYRLDLRQWVTWLDTAGVGVFTVQRAHIELYARWAEANGLARATIGRRLSTVCGFYRYCAQEDLIDRDPSAHGDDRSRITNRRHSVSTAMSSAASSSKPAFAADATTPSPAC